MTGPCEPLITVAELTACCEAAVGAEPAHVDTAIDAASFIAWALSGRRYGICTVTAERPGRVNDACCPVAPCGCGCPAPSVVWLAHGPVVAVDEVRIGGVPVEDFTLLGTNRLVRQPPERWPACQFLGSDVDDDDVLVVDYDWGIPVDAFGAAAIAAYACELLKACQGKDCALPERLTSVTRQGVSFVIEASQDWLDKGRTGVPLLDQWLTAVNPEALKRPASVRSPDLVAPV